jgi:prepilin-type N-terminal cleavage/methylation domain-containing protein/prepilin-type processing-associated H-X9-DG protein
VPIASAIPLKAARRVLTAHVWETPLPKKFEGYLKNYKKHKIIAFDPPLNINDHMQRSSIRKSGFTLIELLVVITIIGILIGLSSVGLQRALKKARDTKSVSNLTQIGQALLLYSGENNGKLPIARGSLTYQDATDNPTDNTKWPWQYQIHEFISEENEVFHSPNVPQVEYGYYIGARAAYVQALAEGKTGVDLFVPVYPLRMNNPSHHIMAGECLYWSGSSDDADKDDYTQRPSFRTDNEPGEMTPILFADGHVESFNQFDPEKMTASYEGLGSPYPATPTSP